MLCVDSIQTVGNLIERRLYETKENKQVPNFISTELNLWIIKLICLLTYRRLLEKSQRIEAILASLQATGAETEQLTEVEEMITAPERQQLESLRHHINKYSTSIHTQHASLGFMLTLNHSSICSLCSDRLDSSENQVDETIFLLESYIYSTKSSR